MKKRIFWIGIIFAVVLGLFAIVFNQADRNIDTNIDELISGVETKPESLNDVDEIDLPDNKQDSKFAYPMNRSNERVTKKYFGTYVTPRNSPVQPEKFSGYHTGSDFEIFSEESDKDVPVYAVCAGKLLVKRTAGGYGGVIVQACQLDGKPITAVYGHLKVESVAGKIGDKLAQGAVLGILGKGYSRETDGERKHLHLGFHKGSAVNILGYVQNASELENWIDPCNYVCEK